MVMLAVAVPQIQTSVPVAQMQTFEVFVEAAQMVSDHQTKTQFVADLKIRTKNFNEQQSSTHTRYPMMSSDNHDSMSHNLLKYIRPHCTSVNQNQCLVCFHEFNIQKLQDSVQYQITSYF